MQLKMQRNIVMSLMIFTLLGCVGPAFADNQPTASKIIMDADWVESKLNIEGVVIVDVRKPEVFEKSHVKGAINIPISSTYDVSSRKHRLLPPSDAQALLSSHGVGNNDLVIIYDGGMFVNAARFVWLLETYGHEKVAILNGGYAAWQQANKPTASGKVMITRKSEYTPSMEPERFATLLTVRMASSFGDRLLLDTRPKDEYLGKKTKYTRFGHIPKAAGIEWKNNVDIDEGMMLIKSPKALKKLYSDLDPEKTVITYCNVGKASAFTYLVLRELGFQVAVYDGGWFEWSEDQSLPVINRSDS